MPENLSDGSRASGVDIGIPSSGRPRYLRAAVKSVLAQTFKDWRLIVSEDGKASEGVAAILREYLGDSRITYSATGFKVGAARNMTGFLETGSLPYVALLHDDDRWEPEFLARRVDFLERHPECAFVFSPVILIDENGREIERLRRVLADGVYAPRDVVPRLLRENIVPVPSVVVRRSAYEAVGPAFYEALHRIYDYEMWLRLATSFPVGYLGLWDACWRLHGAQSSSSLRDRPVEYETFLRRADQLLAKTHPDLRLTNRQRRRRLAGWLLTSALDALAQRDYATSRALLRRSLRADGRSLMDPRVLALAVGLLFGPPGRWTVGGVRRIVRRHGLSIHLVR